MWGPRSVKILNIGGETEQKKIQGRRQKAVFDSRSDALELIFCISEREANQSNPAVNS